MYNEGIRSRHGKPPLIACGTLLSLFFNNISAVLILVAYRAAIQASASILGQNMNGLVEHLAKHSDTLNSSVVYPSTNYPGRTQEGLLGQLLRKKYEPQVETWVDEGRAMQSGSKEGKEEDVEDLWNWAAEWIGPRVAKYVGEDSRDHYTFEEQEAGIENVRTGLRRTLDEEDSEEDDDGDDDDEEMEDITLEGTAASAPSTSNVGKADGGARVKKTKLADILRLAGSGVVLDQ
jgi:mediator of RNA polymerase II transcription subunit 8